MVDENIIGNESSSFETIFRRPVACKPMMTAKEKPLNASQFSLFNSMANTVLSGTQCFLSAHTICYMKYMLYLQRNPLRWDDMNMRSIHVHVNPRPVSNWVNVMLSLDPHPVVLDGVFNDLFEKHPNCISTVLWCLFWHIVSIDRYSPRD